MNIQIVYLTYHAQCQTIQPVMSPTRKAYSVGSMATPKTDDQKRDELLRNLLKMPPDPKPRTKSWMPRKTTKPAK